MSAVKKSKTQPKLVKMLREPGGVRVREALARAEAALRELHAACLESIDAALDQMERELPGWPATADEIYDQSTRVIDACNQPSEKALVMAARSLCDIVDQLDPQDPRTLEAVKVHVKAFRVLHRSEAGEDSLQLILAGLEAVCAKLRVEPSASPPSEEDIFELDDMPEPATAAANEG